MDGMLSVYDMDSGLSYLVTVDEFLRIWGL